MAELSRASGRGSGSVVGGHAILAIDPKALAHFSAGRQSVLVSGTNGKTTTTKLLAEALAASAGTEVVTNLQGANLPTGVAAALAGGRPGLPAVLEVDEAWLGHVAAQVKPAAVVLLNLSRDQLDRNNEVRHVAHRWRRTCQDLPAGALVVANADDPLVAWAAMGHPGTVWVAAGISWTSDAAGCPECGGPVVFSSPGWKCESCGLSRPLPGAWEEPGSEGPQAVLAPADAAPQSGPAQRLPLELRLPGRCNLANALTVLATVGALGYAIEPAAIALRAVEEVAGRYATVRSGKAVARLLLAKNPAGWSEVFDMLGPAGTPVVVAINARTADGHDPSWLWDVPFERLSGRTVVATGERCLDLAVRLHYAEVEHVVERDIAAAVLRHEGAVDVVANYTAFHQLLASLSPEGRTGGGGWRR